MPFRFSLDRIGGALFVLLLHAVALYGLWNHRLIPSPAEATTLFVNFIAPPAPEKAAEPERLPPPQPRSMQKPQPRQIGANTPIVAPTDYIAPPPPPTPVPVIDEAPPMPLPAEPVALSTELSASCPERVAPVYPALSRHLGETGLVVLRVELSETGHVAIANVQTSSGYARLDNAALIAVHTWRCNPAVRNGQPVHAIAIQPFNFILQGS